MIYVLLVLATHGQGVAMATQEFYEEPACVRAAEALRHAPAYSKTTVVAAYCVPKGQKPSE